MSKLSTPQSEFSKFKHWLDTMLVDASNAPVSVQYFAAEIGLIRLCFQFEAALEGVYARILSGAGYLDGSNPNTAVKFGTIAAATEEMRKNGGQHYLKWSKKKFALKNIRKLIDKTDHGYMHLDATGAFIDDLFLVRNHIAHGNSRTAALYRGLLYREYGTKQRGVAPGRFLLSSRFSPRKIDEYSALCFVFINDLVK